KVKVLQEQIEHHVEEEEKPKTGVFAQARDSDMDLKALGEQLAARKRELTDDYRATGIPEPELKTMDEVAV
ncbi:MAG TPA: hemerythrin domain-containing protein, partial [Sphingomicrobium sp.]